MKDKVWDRPVRLIHWALVLLVAFSWWTAETGRNDLHVWSGYAILLLVLWRLVWGLVGSSTARFASFVRGPGAVLDYVRSGFRWTEAGHTPLGALASLALFAAVAFQVATGLLSLDEDGLTGGSLAHLVSFHTSEKANALHHFNFDVLVVLIGIHVTAVAAYRVLLGLDLLSPMISGKADLAPGVEPMRPVPAAVAALSLAVAVAIASWIVAGAPPLG